MSKKNKNKNKNKNNIYISWTAHALYARGQKRPFKNTQKLVTDKFLPRLQGITFIKSITMASIGFRV